MTVSHHIYLLLAPPLLLAVVCPFPFRFCARCAFVVSASLWCTNACMLFAHWCAQFKWVNVMQKNKLRILMAVCDDLQTSWLVSRCGCSFNWNSLDEYARLQPFYKLRRCERLRPLRECICVSVCMCGCLNEWAQPICFRWNVLGRVSLLPLLKGYQTRWRAQQLSSIILLRIKFMSAETFRCVRRHSLRVHHDTKSI